MAVIEAEFDRIDLQYDAVFDAAAKSPPLSPPLPPSPPPLACENTLDKNNTEVSNTYKSKLYLYL